MKSTIFEIPECMTSVEMKSEFRSAEEGNGTGEERRRNGGENGNDHTTGGGPGEGDPNRMGENGIQAQSHESAKGGSQQVQMLEPVHVSEIRIDRKNSILKVLSPSLRLKVAANIKVFVSVSMSSFVLGEFLGNAAVPYTEKKFGVENGLSYCEKRADPSSAPYLSFMSISRLGMLGLLFVVGHFANRTLLRRTMMSFDHWVMMTGILLNTASEAILSSQCSGSISFGTCLPMFTRLGMGIIIANTDAILLPRSVLLWGILVPVFGGLVLIFLDVIIFRPESYDDRDDQYKVPWITKLAVAQGVSGGAALTGIYLLQQIYVAWRTSASQSLEIRELVFVKARMQMVNWSNAEEADAAGDVDVEQQGAGFDRIRGGRITEVCVSNSSCRRSMSSGATRTVDETDLIFRPRIIRQRIDPQDNVLKTKLGQRLVHNSKVMIGLAVGSIFGAMWSELRPGPKGADIPPGKLQSEDAYCLQKPDNTSRTYVDGKVVSLLFWVAMFPLGLHVTHRTLLGQTLRSFDTWVLIAGFVRWTMAETVMFVHCFGWQPTDALRILDNFCTAFLCGNFDALRFQRGTKLKFRIFFFGFVFFAYHLCTWRFMSDPVSFGFDDSHRNFMWYTRQSPHEHLIGGYATITIFFFRALVSMARGNDFGFLRGGMELVAVPKRNRGSDLATDPAAPPPTVVEGPTENINNTDKNKNSNIGEKDGPASSQETQSDEDQQNAVAERQGSIKHEDKADAAISGVLPVPGSVGGS